MQLTGDVKLIRKFKALPVKMQKKYGRRALTKAGRKTINAAKKNIPSTPAPGSRVKRRTGMLKKSMGQKGRTYGDHTVITVIGPRGSSAKGKPSPFRIENSIYGGPHDPAKIAHLVERSRPFLRPAYDSTKDANLALIGRELAAGLAAEAGQ